MLLNEGENQHILDLMREICCYRLKSLWITYANEYYDDIVTIPSLSTVARTLKRNKFSSLEK